MIQPRSVNLWHAPSEEYVGAEIVSLTDEMVQVSIYGVWWDSEELKPEFDPRPIDLDWQWHDLGIEFEGTYLASEKVAVVGGDPVSIEGVMLISSDPGPSILEPGSEALFVERLFTAPWNRPKLRLDGAPLFRGVGVELLTWGAWFNREKGYGGRLRLDGSPEEVGWYQKRGLQILALEPILHPGVEYSPMELPLGAAQQLLSKWDNQEAE